MTMRKYTWPVEVIVLFCLQAACGGTKTYRSGTEPDRTASEALESAANDPKGGAIEFAGEWIYSEVAGVEFTKTEITLGQFKQCVKAGACKGENFKSKFDQGYCNWGYSDRDNHPMNCVDWRGANAFCTWVGGRLPTDKELWTESANGGEGRKWPWGDTPEISCDYAVWGNGNRISGCGRDRTWPVCSRPLGNSVSGLCDMSGNVWEWTSDDYDSNAKTVFGGSWGNDGPSFLLASSCFRLAPDGQTPFHGFRCVRPPR